MPARRRQTEPETEPKKSRHRPATTPEGRENELASQAYDLAEKQIQAGTASSQTIAHFLKMGSTRERLEQERLAHENELLQVKKEALESAKRVEELYEQAILAMRRYNGDLTEPEGLVEA